MIRMQNRNSSCDCGKTTKERGSFVTKSKIYETRSGAQRSQQGDVFVEEKDDIRINTLKVGDQLFLKNMETSLVSVTPINNKSFNFKNSTIKLSKASINKPCDNNMVVTNGNARTLNGDTLNDILTTKEIKLDILEADFVRSNTDFEESNNCCNKNSHPESRPQAVQVESEKELREDKQNGVYERCDNGECELNNKCFKNGENNSTSHAIENSSLEVESTDEFFNGYLNGNRCELHENEELEFDIEKQIDIEEEANCHMTQENFDLTLSPNKGNKKKRKTSLETIFDLNAEFGDQFGYCSDKRRNRRPPESFSPEPTRRVKLENLYEDKGPPTNLATSGKEKKKVGRKRKQKGPIYHYLDLYIKNKEIKEKCIKQEVVEEQLAEPLIDEALIKKEIVDAVVNTSGNLIDNSFSDSFIESNSTEPYIVIDNFTTTNIDTIDVPSDGNIDIINTIVECPLRSNTTNFDNCHLLIEKLNPCNLETFFSNRKDTIATIASPPGKPLTSPIIDSIVNPCKKSPTSLSIPTDDAANKKKKKKVIPTKRKKTKEKKPPPGYYDRDISKILGYRQNKGEREFLVCFHNGTSNWITQDNNITIIPQFKEFFEHPDQDLPIINRLAYFLSHRKEKKVDSPDKCYTKVLPIPDASPIQKMPTPIKINSPTKENNSDVSLLVSPNNSVVSSKSDVLTDLSPVSCTRVDPFSINEQYKKGASLQVTKSYSSGYNETLSKSDLNELCNYVMSSRHIKLYPFETNKEVVFKKDDEFMHIYLKNMRKNQEDLRRVDEHLNIRSCEKLIYALEDCVVDDSCEVVVISGIEEYFALNDVFDKLLKKPATIEGKNYEQDVSMLRYLIQTIRNFTKPIAAVIKKTATGLPASMLSLFDMVFDEENEKVRNHSGGSGSRSKFIPETAVTRLKKRGETIRKRSGKSKKKRSEQRKKEDMRRKENKILKKKALSKKNVALNAIDNEDNVSGNYQNYLFPRLMGLTESNESQIMGEGQKINDIFDGLLTSTSYNKHLSQQLRTSLRHMKNNTKIQAKYRGRKQSLTSEEEFESIVDSDYIYTNTVLKRTIRVDSEADIDSLEMELEREKELTKRSMSELESILHSMEPC